MMKPIETRYHGCRFRSRLEAKWAVFFDCMDIEWEYEPEGYDLGDGIWYLPDFRLHGWKGRGSEGHEYLWAEVKGKLPMDAADWQKVSRFAGEHRQDHPFGDETYENPIITLGPIYEDSEEFTDPGNDGSKSGPSFELVDVDTFGLGISIPKDGEYGFELCGCDSNYWTHSQCRSTDAALECARYARFEHGECPNISDGRSAVRGYRSIARAAQLARDYRRDYSDRKDRKDA